MRRYLKQGGIIIPMGQRKCHFFDFVPFVGFVWATVFLFLSCYSNLVLAANETVGMATNVLGELRILRADGIEESIHRKSPLPLFEGDLVQTPENGLAQLALLEGIEVTMNEFTKFTILSRWEKATGFTRILRIIQGELWIKMQGATIPIEVETPVALAAMGGPEPPSLEEQGLDPFGLLKYTPQELLGKRDTEFTVQVTRDGQTTVQVLEGAVEFGTAFNTWVLPPSTVSVAIRGQRCTRPRPIDVESTMGWTEALSQ